MTVKRPLRTLIVDDEELARQRLADMLADMPAVRVVGEAENGAVAVKAIADQRPELVFLDVQMPGLDGFGVLRCTRSAHRPLVVFVTAFDEHAIRAFDVHAADYLLKPVSRSRLLEAVRRVVERASVRDTSQTDSVLERLLSDVPGPPQRSVPIPVKGRAATHLVRADDISWIEADGDLVLLHVARGVHRVRKRLAELEERLRDSHFVRVHRSAIVNVAAVRSIEPIAKGGYYVWLMDGARVRSSRQYRAAVQALLK